MEVENERMGMERKICGIEPMLNRADRTDQVSRYSGRISTLPRGKEDAYDFVTGTSERGVDSASGPGTEKGAEWGMGRTKLNAILERGSDAVWFEL
jgi:hypothetical protein